MDHNDIQDLIDKRRDEREPLAKIEQVDETTLTVNGHIFAIEKNENDAFDFGAFNKVYNPYLNSFDYIVGDWGFDQLRLKGFYLDDKPVPKELKSSAINDYIVEDVNFGSKYFVLHNLEAKNESPLPQISLNENKGNQKKHKNNRPKNKKAKNNNKRKHRFTQKDNKKQPNKKAKRQNNQSGNEKNNHKFVIKQK